MRGLRSKVRGTREKKVLEAEEGGLVGQRYSTGFDPPSMGTMAPVM